MRSTAGMGWATLVAVSLAGPTPAAGQDHRPVVSPDGRELAFMSNRDGPWAVYLMPMDRSAPARRVSDDPRGEWYADWSPDGRALVYHRQDPDTRTTFLLRYDVATARETPLGRADGDRRYARWSPDGRTIDYMCPSGTCRMSADGRELGASYGLDHGEKGLAVAPDGGWIAFTTAGADGPEDAYLRREDGSGEVRLTQDDGRTYGLDWSPDGRFIAYNSSVDGNMDVYVYDVGTGTRRRLTRAPSEEHLPRWSPDGAFLVFTSTRSGPERIYRIDPDGRNLRRVDTSSDDPGSLLIANVSVVDAATGTVNRGCWVGIRSGLIEVVADEEPAGWQDATRIDGQGRYLVPGLIDMHIHPRSTDDLESLLVNGVTATRLAMGTPTYLRWRDAIEAGDMPGPRLVVASPFFWDRGPDGFGYPTPDTATVARELRDVYAEGYDLVKVVDVYDHAVAEALFADAAQLGLPVMGHVADDAQTPFDWAWNAGLGYRTIEHLDEMVRLALSAAPTEAELAAFVDVARRSRIGVTTLLSPWIANQRALGRAARGEEAYSGSDQEDAFLVSAAQGRARLLTDNKTMAARTPEDLRASIQDSLVVFYVLRRLVAAGVPVVPGTEGPRTWRWAGATLHDELDLMVQAGLSPAEVLRAATLDAARLLDLDGVTGLLRAGDGANLLLVDANPLEDLGTLRRPVGVAVAGRWYGSTEMEVLRNRFPELAGERRPE